MTARPYSQEDGVSLYHGDCRDVLFELPAGSVDLLLTDPPYGKHYVAEGRPVRRMNIRADGARQGVADVEELGHDHPAPGPTAPDWPWFLRDHGQTLLEDRPGPDRAPSAVRSLSRPCLIASARSVTPS